MNKKPLLVISAIVLIGTIAFALWLKTSQQKPNALVVWHTENDPATQKKFDEVGIAFRAATGVEVIYEYIPWGNLSKRLFLAFEAKDESLLPDITHLQPYMAFSLFDQGRIEDITEEVVEIEKAGNGKIRASVRELQNFSGRYYGVAQHVGVSLILYRKDHLAARGLTAPRTWDEFFEVCEKLRVSPFGPQYAPVTAPGVSPFFMECIFNELLNSRGGRIIDGQNSRIELNTQEVRDVLKVAVRLASYAGPRFARTEYLEQFKHIESGDATFMMFAGARAFKTFEEKDPSAATTRYGSLEPPSFGERKSYTSLDCEPFVILRRSQAGRKELAKIWLKTFFADGDRYRSFCESVPIQLMPIFPKLDATYAKNPAAQKWKEWYDQATRMIDSGRAIPYFLQNGADKDVDFLLSFHNRGIIHGMIGDVVRGIPVDEAIAKAQSDADLVTTDGHKKK